jgi:hypothetical protein
VLFRSEGRYFLDLANAAWQAVEVDADGWRVLDRPPVRFRRTPTSAALPIPVPGGDLAPLWRVLNIEEADRPLVVAWLLENLRPETPKPVLELGGEQGSGKSDTQERLRGLFDPSAVPLRAAPKNTEDLYVAAANSWAVSLNNLSHLTAAQQDALCTLSTGGGFGSRTLYTNGEETVLEAKRPVLLNGIGTLATAQDLVDRTLRFELPNIDGRRRTATDLAEEYEASRPALLGALLDLFAATLRELPGVTLPRLPRMADFALLGEAMFRAFCRKDSFLALYEERRRTAALHALEASPAASAVLSFAERSQGATVWDGPVKGLLEAVAHYRQDVEGWPRSARGFADALRRAAPGLRAAGVRVTFDPQRHNDGHHVTLTKEPTPPAAVNVVNMGGETFTPNSLDVARLRERRERRECLPGPLRLEREGIPEKADPPEPWSMKL